MQLKLGLSAIDVPLFVFVLSDSERLGQRKDYDIQNGSLEFVTEV